MQTFSYEFYILTSRVLNWFDSGADSEICLWGRSHCFLGTALSTTLIHVKQFWNNSEYFYVYELYYKRAKEFNSSQLRLIWDLYATKSGALGIEP